jgi:hypothetical protein
MPEQPNSAPLAILVEEYQVWLLMDVGGKQFQNHMVPVYGQEELAFPEQAVRDSPGAPAEHSCPANLHPQTTWMERWGFLAFFLSRKARQEVVEPAWQELLEDYAIACEQYPTKLQQRCIKIIFAWRAIRLILECIRAVVGDRFMQFLERLAPQLVRWWLTW